MCGITGYVWGTKSPPISSGEFDRMTDLLQHRGPDGRGVHRIDRSDGSGVLLGHRRLSIIDLAGGKQPLSNEDETIWISFNGEIYNYRELRPSLESAGHIFRTHSDTETIVHLYEQYGEDFVNHLRGMFAIAIWDENLRKLILVRDRMGQKPLVYCMFEDRLVFASELKSVLAAKDVPRNIRVNGIDEYLLYGYIPHPETIYSGIHKLPPAHMAVFQDGRLRTQRYWNPDLEPDSRLEFKEVKERLDHVIDEAVRLRMRSDVPFGAFLSGGIDSTVIVGLMQRHSNAPTKTYTIGFPEGGYDESPYAREAAEFLGTEHHQMEVQPDSLEVIEKLVWHFDEPFADSSAIPTYYVSQMTRQHVKVALTGDGGDELFCGYPRYRTVSQLGRFDRMPNILRRALTGPWVDWIPDGPQRSFRQRLKHRLRILRDSLPKRYVSWMTGFPLSRRQQLYNPDFLASIDLKESARFLENSFRYEGKQPGINAMRADLISYLPCDLLAKVDITSMAHGLECRSPFMDHRVVETALQIPFEFLCQTNQIKPCLTRTFASLVPENLRSRPKKGFSVPLDRWFRNDLQSFAADTLLATDSFCQAYISQQAIRKLLSEHHSGQWAHGDRIWSLLFLELWGKNSSRASKRAPLLNGV